METKQEVCEQNLKMYIVLPTDDTNFENWWKNLLLMRMKSWFVFPMSSVDCEGKNLIVRKLTYMKSFLKFVDNNSTPNGRQADSCSSTFYFLTKFRRIEPPKLSEKNYSDKVFKLPSQLVNHAQESQGEPTAGSYAI